MATDTNIAAPSVDMNYTRVGTESSSVSFLKHVSTSFLSPGEKLPGDQADFSLERIQSNSGEMHKVSHFAEADLNSDECC
jgi:hypothetical protein